MDFFYGPFWGIIIVLFWLVAIIGVVKYLIVGPEPPSLSAQHYPPGYPQDAH